jgi:hypothetical protein
VAQSHSKQRPKWNNTGREVKISTRIGLAKPPASSAKIREIVKCGEKDRATQVQEMPKGFLGGVGSILVQKRCQKPPAAFVCVSAKL